MNLRSCSWLALVAVTTGQLGTACVTGDKPVSEQEQPSCLASLCDSIAKTYGGYASHVQCPDGTEIRTFLSRSECLERFPAAARLALTGDAGTDCKQEYEQALEDCASASARTRCAARPTQCDALTAGQ